ncbi:hypothetical protein GCM10027174_26080 [Salinifilum aidingensis]
MIIPIYTPLRGNNFTLRIRRTVRGVSAPQVAKRLRWRNRLAAPRPDAVAAECSARPPRCPPSGVARAATPRSSGLSRQRSRAGDGDRDAHLSGLSRACTPDILDRELSSLSRRPLHDALFPMRSDNVSARGTIPRRGQYRAGS